MSTRELKKVFYVEDDPHIQRIGQMALEKVGGFEVRMYSSGSQALSEVHDFVSDALLCTDGCQSLALVEKLHSQYIANQ